MPDPGRQGQRRGRLPTAPDRRPQGPQSAVRPPPQLSNRRRRICDMAQKSGVQKRQSPLKNGSAGPIQTLNVVTGPPKVGEVNTSDRA
jgi:hypothetical protein